MVSGGRSLSIVRPWTVRSKPLFDVPALMRRAAHAIARDDRQRITRTCNGRVTGVRRVPRAWSLRGRNGRSEEVERGGQIRFDSRRIVGPMQRESGRIWTPDTAFVVGQISAAQAPSPDRSRGFVARAWRCLSGLALAEVAEGFAGTPAIPSARFLARDSAGRVSSSESEPDRGVLVQYVAGRGSKRTPVMAGISALAVEGW